MNPDASRNTCEAEEEEDEEEEDAVAAGECVVGHLVGQRVRPGCTREYFVHWDGYSVEERTWVGAEDIRDKTLIPELEDADGPNVFVTECDLTRHDGSKQLGLYARKSIPQDEAICEYRGARIPKSLQQPGKYVLEVSDEPVVIDGLSESICPFYVPGSPAVYANHSSKPNARVDKRDGGMWLISTAPIEEGQEIRFDYTERYWCAFGGAPRETRDWKMVRRSPPPPVTGPVRGSLPPQPWVASRGARPGAFWGGADERLQTLVPRFRRAMAADGIPEARLWELIASAIPGRSPEDCRQRWRMLNGGSEREGLDALLDAADLVDASAGAAEEASSSTSGRPREPATDEPPPKRRSSANSADAGSSSTASPGYLAVEGDEVEVEVSEGSEVQSSLPQPALPQPPQPAMQPPQPPPPLLREGVRVIDIQYDDEETEEHVERRLIRPLPPTAALQQPQPLAGASTDESAFLSELASTLPPSTFSPSAAISTGDGIVALPSRPPSAAAVPHAPQRRRAHHTEDFKIEVVIAALKRPPEARIKPTCACYPGIEPCQLRKWIGRYESRALASMGVAPNEAQHQAHRPHHQPRQPTAQLTRPIPVAFAYPLRQQPRELPCSNSAL